MYLAELRLENLRLFESLELRFDPGINLFTGANGAGKTSILESVYVLSHGRSFRTANRDVLGRLGGGAVSVFGHVVVATGTGRRVGLQRQGTRWLARIDGQAPGSLTDLLREIAVTCFEPGSHALISGSSQERRSFIDWALFHVEPEFLNVSRRYLRALKQRNALLRVGARRADFEPWEIELAAAGEQVTVLRQRYLDGWRPVLVATVAEFLGELGAARLDFKPGWDLRIGLAEALAEAREHDLARGFSTLGPHRADWSLRFERAPQREHLSRGQEKLCALACVLAQSQRFADQTGEWPIVCLDDLASELDIPHQALVVARLAASGAQVLVTGTVVPATLADVPHRRFHVEQGLIS